MAGLSVETCDVVVVGGGNAGLCAALAARGRGARVIILERAPHHMRGGNSRHTRNLRCVHDDRNQFTSGAYTEEEFVADLLSVSGNAGAPDSRLMRLFVQRSRGIPRWAASHGIRWQQPIAGTLGLSRTNMFFLGGGKELLNTYYRRAGALGVDVRYEARVVDLLMDRDDFEGVLVVQGATRYVVKARAAVVAAGGFEANLDWLSEYWGDGTRNFLVRGTPHNDGALLRLLIDRGAQVVGDARGVHCVSIDARSPKYDGGIATRVDGIPLGIVVNKMGERFHDEGEELWPKRYAIWGRLTAEQPDQIAYVILDARTIHEFIPPMFPAIQAPSLPELAARLDDAFGLARERFLATVQRFNAAAAHNRSIRPEVLDGAGTRDLRPPKSNWALPVTQPPFFAFPLRPGVTFTYMGVAVDERARILRTDGAPYRNLFAAGEIMAGNILSRGYLAGVGMAIGTVFGQIAGAEAQAYASQ